MRTACPDPQGLPSMCWRACGLTRRLMCARSARPASCRRPGHGRPLGTDRNGCTRTTTGWPPRRIQARRSKARRAGEALRPSAGRINTQDRQTMRVALAKLSPSARFSTRGSSSCVDSSSGLSSVTSGSTMACRPGFATSRAAAAQDVWRPSSAAIVVRRWAARTAGVRAVMRFRITPYRRVLV